MIEISLALEAIWSAVAVHLWQATLVLVPLVVIAWLVRRAPGRLRGLAWALGMSKIILPLGVLAGLWSALMPSAPLQGSGPAVTAPPALVLVIDALALSADPAPSTSSSWPIALTILWLMGAAILVARWVIASRRAPPVALVEAAVDQRLWRALAGTGLDRKVVSVVSGGAPCVRGVVRPRIHVPAELIGVMDEDALRALLLHEAAHVTRREPLRELGRRIVAVVFFFYPPLWLVLRGLRSAAEMSCDEWALERGAAPMSLATAIATSVRFAATGAPLAAMASTRPRSLLRERFDRLERPTLHALRPRHRVAVAMGLAIVGASALVPSLPVAASGSTPVLSSLRVPPPAVSPREVGADLVVRVGVDVSPEGAVDGVTYVHVMPDVPDSDASQLEEAAREFMRQARLMAAPTGKRSDAIVEIVWQVGTSLKPSSGEATIESMPGGSRAVVPAPSRITTGVKPPILVHQVPPAYPASVKALHLQGDVVLGAVIGSDGLITDVKVLRGVDGQPSLDESVLAAVRQWVYEPATRDGVPLSVSIMVTVRFRFGE